MASKYSCFVPFSNARLCCAINRLLQGFTHKESSIKKTQLRNQSFKLSAVKALSIQLFSFPSYVIEQTTLGQTKISKKN